MKQHYIIHLTIFCTIIQLQTTFPSSKQQHKTFPGKKPATPFISKEKRKELLKPLVTIDGKAMKILIPPPSPESEYSSSESFNASSCSH